MALERVEVRRVRCRETEAGSGERHSGGFVTAGDCPYRGVVTERFSQMPSEAPARRLQDSCIYLWSWLGHPAVVIDTYYIAFK